MDTDVMYDYEDMMSDFNINWAYLQNHKFFLSS